MAKAFPTSQWTEPGATSSAPCVRAMSRSRAGSAVSTAMSTEVSTTSSTAAPVLDVQLSVYSRETGAQGSTVRTSRVQAPLQVATDGRPLRHQDAVHHAVPHGAVPAPEVMAKHAVLPGSESLDGTLGAEVEVVGPEAHEP